MLTDIDGTLTLRRGSLVLSLEAVEAVRALEGAGLPVGLVTGNSVPVAAGLARYMGATGPVVAENGCTLFHRGSTVHLCSGKPPAELEEALSRAGFRPSWQNPYRHHDLAFLPPEGWSPSRALETVLEAMRAAGWEGEVLWSGFAFHIAPRGVSKARGAREAARLVGVSLEETLAVGDGENDLDFLEAAGYSAAPADASPAVRERVRLVASKPGGAGFAEIARLALEGRLP